MARYEPEQNVTLSILDRLIDSNPNARTDAPLNRANSMRQLKSALRRDLEWLLNTRQSPEAVGEGTSELRRSLYNYGLPDTTALTTFEPRLMGVRVTLEPVTAGSRILRFQIQGLLRVDPAPERVAFDTVLELTKGEYEVKGD
jgi:type VI secretion system protein ImpF